MTSALPGHFLPLPIEEMPRIGHTPGIDQRQMLLSLNIRTQFNWLA